MLCLKHGEFEKEPDKLISRFQGCPKYWEYDNIEHILNNVLQHFNLINKTDTYDESLVKKFLVNDLNWSYEKYIKQGQI